MIPTFLIDLPVMLLFGALFAILTRRGGGSFSVFSDAAFWKGIVFASIFNAAVLYAAIVYPDWMWMYFLEEPRLGFWPLLYLFLFLYYLPYILGFYLGKVVFARGIAVWIIFCLFCLGWEGWLIVTLFDRYAVVGTREEFLSGTALSLFSPSNRMGMILNGSVAVMVLFYLVCVWQHVRRRTAESDFETET